MFKTILFPLDSSRESHQTAELVAELVNFYSSRLVLLSVVEAPEAAEADGGMTDAAAIAELLENAKAVFAQQGIQAEAIEREGKPAFMICEVAEEVGANLIVMGYRGGFDLTEEEAANSVTKRVLDLSLCPVLVVP
jgi:nucleotide-binding universal stress UspA family protein